MDEDDDDNDDYEPRLSGIKIVNVVTLPPANHKFLKCFHPGACLVLEDG